MTDLDKEKTIQINKLAKECLDVARDALLVNMRFLDVALMKLPYEPLESVVEAATDGEHFYYSPIYILQAYKEDSHLVARTYLHSMFHVIFNHSYNYDKKQKELWDIACDIAIENIIMNLNLSAVTLKDDNLRNGRLRGLKKNLGELTAQKIYKHFLINGLAKDDEAEYRSLFRRDLHIFFEKREQFELSSEQWKRISERIKTELKSFSKVTGDNESLIRNLMEATKDTVDYEDILRHFLTMSEESMINDEEFDYIYYNYGMTYYDNMPFIEPLEYKDVKKVKDFAIVLDTSASCKGSILKNFLRHTYKIMKQQENFFNNINVHIIECDNEVRSDTKITCDKDFDDYIAGGRLKGFGGTDFRPAFDYIDGLISDREFDNFKGLIYFTDGYGIFPERIPDYDAMFVFINNDSNKITAPWWAIKVELEAEEFES